MFNPLNVSSYFLSS
jgi:magnesium-transporting ATPase (P-type)